MTLRIYIFSALVLICIVVSACRYNAKELAFTDKELAFVNPYHEDDTLYFKDLHEHCDTVIIKSIGKDQNDGFGLKNHNPVYNREWVTAAHLQSDYWRGATKNTTGNGELTFQNIIMIEKMPEQKKSNIAIEFRNFKYSSSIEKLGAMETTPIALGGRTLTSYYILINQKLGSATDSTNITSVYWTREEGLTAYRNGNGNVWVKASLMSHH